MKFAACAALAAVLVLTGCTTPDTILPTVTGCAPADGATSVIRNTSVRVTFSEDMETSSVEAAFGLTPSATGAFAWSGATSLTFTPDQSLDSHTTCTITIGTGASDPAGNGLAAEYTSSFTTGGEVRASAAYMLGRSVNEGWFYHWGWEGDDGVPVIRNGVSLYHRTIETPGEGHEMVNSVREAVEAIPVDSGIVVFFKFCFEDFFGGSQEEADTNLARNRMIIDSVCAIVVDRHGYRLILGNALPKTAAETDQFLKWNHGQHNDYITARAAARPEVFAFDLYGVLADPTSGAIRPEYAESAGDPHLNEAGYNALDTPWDALLDVVFGD